MQCCHLTCHSNDRGLVSNDDADNTAEWAISEFSDKDFTDTLNIWICDLVPRARTPRHVWNVNATDFIPCNRKVCENGLLWNIHAPVFIPRAQRNVQCNQVIRDRVDSHSNGMCQRNVSVPSADIILRGTKSPQLLKFDGRIEKRDIVVLVMCALPVLVAVTIT